MEKVSAGIFDFEDIKTWAPYCNHHQKPIHEKPYFIDCEQYQDCYCADIPVPGTCEHYEYKGKAEWTIEEVV